MKRIIAMILCLLMCAVMLVSCADPIIGADLDEYKDKYKPEVREDMELDFYIVVGEGTTPAAISTVTRMINSYLGDKYDTTLDIHYLSESEYVDTTVAATTASGDDRADIVLVLGVDMFNTLYDAGSLINLNTYFSSNEFGRLNSNDVIAKPLLGASIVSETINGQNYNSKYVVPNNRPVGSYDYIMINKDAAQMLNFSPEKISLMNSLTCEYVVELLNRVESDRASLEAAGINPDTVVVEVKNATYLDRNEYVNNGYVCNVSRTPTVSFEEAHETSFAIIKQENDNGTKYQAHYERCMEVIYNLNLDVEFRNLLQYGVLNTTYTMDENEVVTPVTSDGSVYNMNLMHTGDIFKAYYNTIDWSKADAEAGLKQNSEAKVAE